MQDFRDIAIEKIKNKTALVFCGGGVLGIAECGALIQLEKRGLNLKNITFVTGSSVGSILATVVACKGTTEYMKKMLDSMDFNRFHDNDCFLRSAVQLIKNYGLNDVDEIRRLAAQLLVDLVDNADITFRELYDKTGIHLSITYLSVNYEYTFSADYISEPDSLVREAIVKSSTIPLFYEAYVEGKCKSKLVSCDGGTANNYPINIPRDLGIDPDKILGLKLIASKEINHVDNGGPGISIQNNGPPKNVVEYLMSVVNILRKQALRMHVSKNDWQITVKINVGTLSSTDFALTKEQSKWLFQQGVLAADEYVDELECLLMDRTYNPN